MERELEGRDARRVRIYTETGMIEGVLVTSAGVSTLHYLNVVSVSQNFLTLRPPLDVPDHWSFEDAPLAITTASILFVVERTDFQPTPGDPLEAARFQRAPVRLRIADHAVEGFVHVPPGGDALARLNQDRHAFVAITSASVIGPENQFAAPFMAVNRSFIKAIQSVPSEEPVAVGAVADASVED